VDELKVNKSKFRKLPVQKNFADTSENGEHPIKGQLKAKPEIQTGRTYFPGLE